MSTFPNDLAASSALRRKREEFMQGIVYVDRMLTCYEDILQYAAVRILFDQFSPFYFSICLKSSFTAIKAEPSLTVPKKMETWYQSVAQMGGAIATQNLQLQLKSSSLATNAEQLLRLLAELKHMSLFSNASAMISEVNNSIEKCRIIQAQTHATLVKVREEVESSISSIEDALFDPQSLIKKSV